ncbi:hypothetical protein MD535_09545 [Vibrio sp. ZSDZ65]|uniref:Uncharacterized protein n=1 Tax=Vibrio qingdaonensis TaxID=2829491 RepID=A0A9X3HWF8_9VIBR|nr:hypothetical protein [Vibrio qingdaonensis]MCW8346249.1 hypothetical protein [Vibrio qingdaonensis]
MLPKQIALQRRLERLLSIWAMTLAQKSIVDAVGAYSNQSITKKLAQSFGIAKKSVEK